MIGRSLLKLLSNCWEFTSKSSRISMVLRAAPRLFSRRHPAMTPRGSRRRPPGVPMLSTFSLTLPDCHPFPDATQLATTGIFNPLSLVLFPPVTVSKLRARFCLALVAPVSNFVPWSVSPGVQCVARRSDEHGSLVSSRCNVHHGLKLCVWHKRHVLLVHVVLELETELQPGSLTAVVRSRSRSKFEDFCSVRRH